MSVYKKFSPLDYATVPFNAHKQYNFDSASAAANQIGVFEALIQITDANKSSIQQLISFIVSEYRFISANGGSVTVIITGESVRFFSALNATGYEPAVVSRQGPLIVEVSFLPISDDQLSWVRCEVIESSVNCDKN